ncbi:MAG: hypothetical protein QW275_02570 [Candidatus Anstonellaceae archaeon]
MKRFLAIVLALSLFSLPFLYGCAQQPASSSQPSGNLQSQNTEQMQLNQPPKEQQSNEEPIGAKKTQEEEIPSIAPPIPAENPEKKETEPIAVGEISKEDMALLDEFIKEGQAPETVLDELPIENPIFEEPS